MNDATRGRVRVEDGPKRVRVYLGGELVADTHARAGVGGAVLPAVLRPRRRRAHGAPRAHRTRHPLAQPRRCPALHGDGRRPRLDAAWQYPDSPIIELRDVIRFDFGAMQWFEEDEEIYTHPRDPHTRIDVLDSSRHVQVNIDGVTVADTTTPRLSSRPASRPATTCPRSTSAWTCSSRPTPRRTARTRAGAVLVGSGRRPTRG